MQVGRMMLRRALALVTVAVVAVGLVGLGAYLPTAVGLTQPIAAQSVAQVGAPLSGEMQAQFEAESFARTELYFGTNKPDGSAVTDEQWRQFLDQEITPRFPDGLTVLTGYGQFRNSKGVIVQERSYVVILLYPSDWRTIRTSSARIEEIRTAYKAAFQQESVLRVDDRYTSRISF